MDQDTALTVACLRCRKQKVLFVVPLPPCPAPVQPPFSSTHPDYSLRCTRERPVCRRCQRVRAECSYPPPPDRKRLALTRAQGHGNDLEAGLRHAASAAAIAAAPALGQSAIAVRPGTHPHMTPPSPPRNLHLSQINVSREVALFLLEIYFERHYQADLLFFKDDLLRDYNAGHLPEHVTLAIFAFAAIFLPSAPGGIVQGTIDISDISRADWSAIGFLWAESAGQLALMNADKPSLHLVQACQVLCLVWFARAQSGRTNMITTIAYRASQLLQFDQARASALTDWSRHRELGVRCFWSCWLTRCASQENARFETDCWFGVAGLPLPLDPGHPHSPAHGPRHSLDKNGRLSATQAQKDEPLGFYSCLVIVQGLWWEILQLSRTMRTKQGSPSQWASTFSTLGKKIEDIESSIPAYHGQSPNLNVGQGRLFSLTYMYHMCIIHLYSSVVPLLSCSPHIPDMSQSLQRFAADKAWEQSKIIMTITDQYLSNRAAVSTLWPIVGYGAYVCAATQMRRLLALKCLTPQRLGRIKIHLSLTGELKKYWRTLEPLHQDMERQFSLAQTFTSTQSREAQATSNAALSPLVTSQDAGVSPEFLYSLRVYVQNDDSPKADEDTTRSNQSTTDRAHSAKPEMSVPSESHQPQTTVVGMDDIEHSHAGSEHSAPPPVMDFLEDGMSPMNAEAMWWNPDMTSLTEIFGMGIYPRDDYDYNII